MRSMDARNLVKYMHNMIEVNYSNSTLWFVNSGDHIYLAKRGGEWCIESADGGTLNAEDAVILFTKLKCLEAM